MYVISEILSIHNIDVKYSNKYAKRTTLYTQRTAATLINVTHARTTKKATSFYDLTYEEAKSISYGRWI